LGPDAAVASVTATAEASSPIAKAFTFVKGLFGLAPPPAPAAAEEPLAAQSSLPPLVPRDQRERDGVNFSTPPGAPDYRSWRAAQVTGETKQQKRERYLAIFYPPGWMSTAATAEEMAEVGLAEDALSTTWQESQAAVVTEAEAELLAEASAAALELDAAEAASLEPIRLPGSLSDALAAAAESATTTATVAATDGETFREAVVSAALYPLFVSHIRQTFPDLLSREGQLRAKCDMRSPEDWYAAARRHLLLLPFTHRRPPPAARRCCPLPTIRCQPARY